MPLPPPLEDLPEDTAVIGDFEAFFAALDSGQIAAIWAQRLAEQQRDWHDWIKDV